MELEHSEQVIYDWDFNVDEFLEKLDDYVAVPLTINTTQEPTVYNVSLPNTPKRKTFGAQMNEMRIEIEKLREEIAFRDAQLLDMYYLIFNKIKDK